jgi:hypothetical protein
VARGPGPGPGVERGGEADASEAAEEGAQLGALGLVEVGEDLGVDLGQDRVDLGERRAAVVGELEDPAAAVLAIAAAGDQVAVLEVVQQADEAARVHAEALGQGLLARRTVVAQVGERDEVALAEPGRDERRAQARAHPSRHARDQDRGGELIDAGTWGLCAFGRRSDGHSRHTSTVKLGIHK